MEELKTKERLAKLSDSLRMAKTLGQLPEEYYETDGMNELLKIHYGIREKETATFKQWLEKGFCVKKGEKSFPIWSSPIKARKKEEKPDGEVKENSYKFFNVCYVFTYDQVAPRGQKVE